MSSINDQIEQTLNALDSMERAIAPEDFENQIIMRLRMLQKWNKWIQYSAAALVIFGLINIFTLLSIDNESQENEALSEYVMSSSAPILNFTDDE
ncbi:MAG: hypothetical protein RIC35_10935 [Marinoscillum sp.]